MRAAAPPASMTGALARLLPAGVTASSGSCEGQAAGKKRARSLHGAEQNAVAGCEGAFVAAWVSWHRFYHPRIANPEP